MSTVTTATYGKPTMLSKSTVSSSRRKVLVLLTHFQFAGRGHLVVKMFQDFPCPHDGMYLNNVLKAFERIIGPQHHNSSAIINRGL